MNICSYVHGVTSFLSFSEIKKIARFLLYGSHIEGWVSEEFHGKIVEETGSDTCMKCHDNDRIKNIEIPSSSPIGLLVKFIKNTGIIL